MEIGASAETLGLYKWAFGSIIAIWTAIMGWLWRDQRVTRQRVEDTYSKEETRQMIESLIRPLIENTSELSEATKELRKTILEIQIENARRTGREIAERERGL